MFTHRVRASGSSGAAGVVDLGPTFGLGGEAGAAPDPRAASSDSRNTWHIISITIISVSMNTIVSIINTIVSMIQVLLLVVSINAV